MLLAQLKCAGQCLIMNEELLQSEKNLCISHKESNDIINQTPRKRLFRQAYHSQNIDSFHIIQLYRITCRLSTRFESIRFSFMLHIEIPLTK